MEEHGHITFLQERYEFTECKALLSQSSLDFECSGPDIFFAFYKLRIHNAVDISAYKNFCVSSDTDDGDLGDYAKFTFFDTDYQFDEPWEVTCLTANAETGVVAFEWNFVIPWGSGRIPKRKRMHGVAKCSLSSV